MDLINNIDLDYLKNKYHKVDEPYNSFNRFDYRGGEYDFSTGLNDEQLEAVLDKIYDDNKNLPHALIKSLLYEAVLNNAIIDVNEKDWFIGLYNWGRPLKKYILAWNKEVTDNVLNESESNKELYQRHKDFIDIGFSNGWLDYDHTVPDWDILMELGFSGLLERIEKSYQKLKADRNLTDKQEIYYQSITRTYKATINFVDRLYQYALTKNGEKSAKTAECLKHIRDGAPSDFYEALQLMYVYFMLSESVDYCQVRSLGYGLDSTLYSFYKNDLDSGRYTKAQIAEFLAYFLYQWQAIDNYWGQPFYLAGMNVDGSTKVNEFSHFILDVYYELGLYNPKIQIKINSSTPRDFLNKALEMIRNGITSIVFVNNDIATKCLMADGFTYEQAVDSVISGCYEYSIKGAASIGIGVCYWNLLTPVSLVIDNGFDTTKKIRVALATGEASELDTFEKFYHAYFAQLKYLMSEDFKNIDLFQRYTSEINQLFLFSGTSIECVEKMTDALDSAIENMTGITVSGIGSAVDALMAVKELVYDKKLVTLEELKKALDNNWEGYEYLQKAALKSKHKYGNGDLETDNYAAAILRFISDTIAGWRNSHGGRLGLEVHSARQYILHGKKSKATPDGRKAGEETSKNASPTPGADVNGVTALIRSATTLDASLPTVGFNLDVMLHPSAVQGEDGLLALQSLVTTYMKNGGASIHFNIFNPETLRDAQKHPEKYKNLQIRVCGWNILWNNMPKIEQDAYILRAENII